MNIHLHKNGKTSGPYSLEKVRKYVQGKVFSDKDLACYDGKKWIQICELPGYTVNEKSMPKRQKDIQKYFKSFRNHSAPISI